MGEVIKEKDITAQPDYWKNICEMQQKQTRKGIEKYGQRLEDETNLTAIDRITYLQEELIDGLMYCEHLKDQIKKVTSTEYMTSVLEKQEPRQVKKYNDIKICPNCENLVHSIYNYCCHCGQKFDKEGQDD